MGSIPGPLIKFRFDVPSAQQAGRQITKTLQSQLTGVGKQSAASFVADWQAAAAKLRASLSTEKLGLNQITQAREKIIGLAQREMVVLQKKNALSKADYALLKNATLEIEKQRNALQGFGAVTSPTRKIVQQMISGISARAGSYGGGMGSFAGLRVNESIGKMADEATGGKLALLAFGGAAVAATAAIVDMAKKGAELAVSMRNASEAAGISVKSMVELKSASAALGVDSDVTVRMFKKFNQELTYASGASLPHASIEAKRAAEVFQLLGVNVQKAAADPMEGFRELSKALSALPDGAIKSATEVMLLGRGGQEAAPLINHLAEAIADTKDSSDALASKIGSAAGAGDKLATVTANLSNQWHTLEVALGQHLIPVLTDVLTLVNKIPGKQIFTPSGMAGVPIIGPGIAAVMLAERAKQAAQNTGGVTGSWTDAGSNATLKKLAGAIVSDSTGSGRKQDFSEPLYLGEALTREWDKYQQMVAKSNEALKEHIELMAKLSAETFAKNSFMTMMLGPIGIAADSPDKTGAGIQKLFDAINKANEETAKKVAHEIVDAWKTFKDEGDRLFDSLLSGGRNFAQALAHDIESIALKPVKDAFGNLMGNILQQLDKLIPNTVSGKAGGKAPGGWLGKIWQGIQKGISPPKSVQNAMETIQNAQITAQNVTIITGSNGLALPRPGASNFTADGLLGLLAGGNNFSATASSGGLLGLLAGNNVPAAVYSGGLLSLIGGNMASTSAAVSGGILGGPLYQGASSTAGKVGGAVLQTLGAAIPGGALLGTGLYKSNPQATALGAGMMAQGALGTLGKLLGGTPGTSVFGGKNNISDIGDALTVLGQIGGGVGQIVAGSQTHGLAGVVQGAMGGAQLGTAILPGIGTAIGAVAGGLISGIFGGGSAAAHQQNWTNSINKAMANQRITLPPSEAFRFASMGSMAQTMSTTFGQGPGGTFSNSPLAANTPFWANAILGTPRNTKAQIQWNALMNGLNTNLPFYGGTTNPFTGGVLPNGLRLPRSGDAYSRNAGVGMPTSGAPSISVHLTIPGYVDKNGVAEISKAIMPHIQAANNKAVYQQSTGARRSIMRGVNLP